ncbi:MAG: hypothetical protein QXL14_02230 [Candidatus Aenigmatarchaeota archaeon]
MSDRRYLLLLLVLAVLAYGIYYTVKSQVDFVREDIPVYAIPVYETELVFQRDVGRYGTGIWAVFPYELHGKPHFIAIEEIFDPSPTYTLKAKIYNITGGLVKEFVIDTVYGIIYSAPVYPGREDGTIPATGYSIGNISSLSLTKNHYYSLGESGFEIKTVTYNILLIEGNIVRLEKVYGIDRKIYFVDEKGEIKYTVRVVQRGNNPIEGGEYILEVYQGETGPIIYNRTISLGEERYFHSNYLYLPIFETKRYIYYVIHLMKEPVKEDERIFVIAFNKETKELNVVLEDAKSEEYIAWHEKYAVSYDLDILHIAQRILIIGNKAYYIDGNRYYLLAGVVFNGFMFYPVEGEYQFYEIHSLQKSDGTITTTREAIGRVYYYEDVGERPKLVCTAPDGTVNEYYGTLLSRQEEFWNIEILGLETKNPISYVRAVYEKPVDCDNLNKIAHCLQNAIVIYDLENKKFSYNVISKECIEVIESGGQALYKYPEQVNIGNMKYLLLTEKYQFTYFGLTVPSEKTIYRVRVLTTYPTIEALEQKYKVEQPPTYQPPTQQPPTYQPPTAEYPEEQVPAPQPTPQPTPGVQTVIEYITKQPILLIVILILIIAILLAITRK